MDQVQDRKTPVHLWIVGVVSLLWNAFGGYDYTMTRLRDMDYLSNVPGMSAEEVLAYIDSFPIWAQVGWGLGVWGSVLGSILLLMRSRHAVTSFAVSLFGAILSFSYQWFDPPAPPAMSEGGMAMVPVFIVVVVALLLYYSYRQKNNGVLR